MTATAAGTLLTCDNLFGITRTEAITAYRTAHRAAEVDGSTHTLPDPLTTWCPLCQCFFDRAGEHLDSAVAAAGYHLILAHDAA